MTAAAPSRQEILDRLRDPEDEFMILPFPADDDINNGSVNLRVGSFFMSADRSSLPFVDASKPWEASRLYHEVHIRPDGAFTMHPHHFVLASTLEYLALPNDLCGLVQSRSTWGRMGLISATAEYVNPSYKGAPTLELVNDGDVPIRLSPYTPICQIVLLSADSVPRSKSRYHCATRPNFSRRSEVSNPSSELI